MEAEAKRSKCGLSSTRRLIHVWRSWHFFRPWSGEEHRLLLRFPFGFQPRLDATGFINASLVPVLPQTHICPLPDDVKDLTKVSSRSCRSCGLLVSLLSIQQSTLNLPGFSRSLPCPTRLRSTPFERRPEDRPGKVWSEKVDSAQSAVRYRMFSGRKGRFGVEDKPSHRGYNRSPSGERSPAMAAGSVRYARYILFAFFVRQPVRCS